MSDALDIAAESDALTIARWCWPEEQWHQNYANVLPSTAGGIGFDDTSMDDPDGYFAVSDAERVVIERGHGRAYGLALLDHLDIGITAWCSDHAEVIATAPLDARMRALAATIRAVQDSA
jgi:hypothetical protein